MEIDFQKNALQEIKQKSRETVFSTLQISGEIMAHRKMY